MYYTQIQSNLIAGYTPERARRLHDLHGDAGPDRLSDVPDGVRRRSRSTRHAATLPARNITIIAGKRDFYTKQFPQYGLDFTWCRTTRTSCVNPRSQVASIGAEREVMHGPLRRRRLRAPALVGSRAHGRSERAVGRSIARRPARSAPRRRPTPTRPILPVTGGVPQHQHDHESRRRRLRRPADRVQLPRQREAVSRRLSYTLSKATNTTEPDGNGIGPNEANIAAARRAGARTEPARSASPRGHHVPATICRYNITVGTVTQLASARPFNSTTGVDNNGDGATNDRPVIDGKVIGKSAFRGTGTQDVVALRRGPDQGRRPQPSCCGWKGSTSSTTPTCSDARQYDVRRHGHADHVRPVRAAVGDDGDSGVREHRSAADVPVSDSIPVLRRAGGWGRAAADPGAPALPFPSPWRLAPPAEPIMPPWLHDRPGRAFSRSAW